MPHEDFQILARFLHSFRDEVSGHAIPLTEDQMKALDQLASGAVTEEEARAKHFEVLFTNLTALEYFAERLKLN